MLIVLYRQQYNDLWWYNSEKIKAKFLHHVWSKTSGQVNSIEEVEKHMKKWVKKQEAISKTKEKIKKWKDAKQNKEKVFHIRKEQNEMEKFITVSDTKRELENEKYKKKNKVRLEEWKEMKQIKKRLEDSNNFIKTFSSKHDEKHVLGHDIPTVNPRPRSLSTTLKKPNLSHNTMKEVTNFNDLKLLQIETNSELIKSYQERDLEIIKQRKERSKNKKRKSFEDIHPLRSNARFNTSQFLTSSMIDLSSYNNPTQSSQAKLAYTTVNRSNHHHPSNSNIQPDVRSSSLMQIEHVPRLRTPAWRSIS